MLGRLGSGQDVAAQNQGGSALGADPLPEPPQVAAARMDSGIEEAGIEASAPRRDDDIAGQGQVDAGTDRGTADRSDGRNGRVRQPHHPRVHLAQWFPAIEQAVQRAASTEHRWISRQHQHPRAAGDGRVDRGGQVVAEPLG